MMNLDNIFLALHVMGVLLWIGGLFATMAFLDAVHAEPEAGPRGRLLEFLRQAAIVPDIGFTVALVFGLHWLFRFKVYENPYMHIKLALVGVLIAIHVVLRLKVRKAKAGEPFTPPPLALKPAVSLLALGVLIFVITKWPPP